MQGRYPHPSAGERNHPAGRTAESVPQPAPAVGEIDLHVALAMAERACCCTAKPVVMAIIPPSASRPDPVDLLLCGHHYRAAKDALEAVGATVHDSRDTPPPEPDEYDGLDDLEMYSWHADPGPI